MKTCTIILNQVVVVFVSFYTEWVEVVCNRTSLFLIHRFVDGTQCCRKCFHVNTLLPISKHSIDVREAPYKLAFTRSDMPFHNLRKLVDKPIRAETLCQYIERARRSKENPLQVCQRITRIIFIVACIPLQFSSCFVRIGYFFLNAL
jgi:hypothetical protein